MLFREIANAEYMSENGIKAILNNNTGTIEINSNEKRGSNTWVVDDGTYTIDFWMPSSKKVVSFNIGADDPVFPTGYIKPLNDGKYALIKMNQGGKNKKTQWKKTGKFVYIRIKSRTSGEFKVTKMPTYANPSKPGQVRVQKKKADGTKYFATFKEIVSP